IHFGYGRTRGGNVSKGIGFNAYALRTADSLWQTGDVKLTRKSGRHLFATTQHTQTMEARDPFRVASYAEFKISPNFARPEDTRVPAELSLFPQWEYKQ